MTLSPPPVPRRPGHRVVYYAAEEPPAELIEALKAADNEVAILRASDGPTFEAALGGGDDYDVIVRFETTQDIENFAKVARQVFMPEDCDVGLIYATTGGTPKDWSKRPEDPRPFGNPNRRAEIFYGEWDNLATRVKTWGQEPRLSNTSGRRAVDIIANPGVNLNPAQTRILRAAFRGCRRVILSPGIQGFSGSLLLRAQATDADGAELPDFMAKIFPDVNAVAEIGHFRSYVRPKLDPRDYSDPDDLRRMAGEGHSTLVSPFVAGPSNKPLTLRGLMSAHPGEVEPSIARLGAVLRFLLRGATTTTAGLDNLYLSRLNPEQRAGLTEALRAIDLPGISNAAQPLDAFVAWLDASAGKASKMGYVHGDLHGDNVAIKDDGGLRPVLIDFAHTHRGHAAADLAALGADILTRVTTLTEDRKSAIQSLFDKAPPGTAPARALCQLLQIARAELACDLKEFLGAMLCRVLWILPRAKETEDITNLRRTARELHHALSEAPT